MLPCTQPGLTQIPHLVVEIHGRGWIYDLWKGVEVGGLLDWQPSDSLWRRGNQPPYNENSGLMQVIRLSK